MNQELSTTEAKRVEQAANLVCSCESDYCSKQSHFKDGVRFAVENILPARCAGFAEWANWNFELSSGGDDKWLHRKENPIRFYTTTELLQKYIHHLQTNKDKEDLHKG